MSKTGSGPEWNAIPTTVIVVSRNRPIALGRCLHGLMQQDHPAFEVVVVACNAGREAVSRSPLADQVRLVAFDEPNIAIARNLGIDAAAGDIVAFIDDDAVAEPTWLSRLARALTETNAAAAGGFVLGRNGISFQWRGRQVNRLGHHSELPHAPTKTDIAKPLPHHAARTEGTNMAFRRDVLAELGGFDPAYRFYLDDTDLNIRLMEAGFDTAIVPQALVHHGFEASATRRSDRVPHSLHQVGASTAVFLRRHASRQLHAQALNRLRTQQRRRLLRHMITGAVEPRDVSRLMQTLFEGVEAGMVRELAQLESRPMKSGIPFMPIEGTGPRSGRVIAGWVWRANDLEHRARASVRAGEIVTVFRFSPTALYHRMRFHPGGYWLQTGGIFGRSDRSGPLFVPQGFRACLQRECARISGRRPL